MNNWILKSKSFPAPQLYYPKQITLGFNDFKSGLWEAFAKRNYRKNSFWFFWWNLRASSCLFSLESISRKIGNIKDLPQCLRQQSWVDNWNFRIFVQCPSACVVLPYLIKLSKLNLKKLNKTEQTSKPRANTEQI